MKTLYKSLELAQELRKLVEAAKKINKISIFVAYSK